MKPEKITVRELCRMVLQKVDEPITVNEVWEIAEKKGYDKMYDSRAENPKANVGSYLSTESDSGGEIQKDDSDYPYRYSLRYPPIFDEKDDENTKKHADQIIDKARQQAKRIIEGAEQRAEKTVVDAEQTAQQKIDSADQQAKEIKDIAEEQAKQTVVDSEQKAKLIIDPEVSIGNDKIVHEKKSTVDTVETNLKVVANMIDESFDRVGLLIEQKLSEATKLRQLAEEDKIKAEGLRKSADDDKVKAEELKKLAEAEKIDAKILKEERQEFNESIDKRNKEFKETQQRIETETKKLEQTSVWASKLMTDIYNKFTHTDIYNNATRTPLKGYIIEVALIGQEDTMKSIQKKIQDIGINTTIREVEVLGKKE